MTNVETEWAVIGNALTDESCAVQVATFSERMFSTLATQTVHAAIRKIIAGGGKCDLITVEAEASKDVTDIAPLLIAAMQKGYPSMFRQYEAILTTCMKRRMLSLAAQEVLAIVGLPGEDPDALAGKLMDTIRNTDGMPQSVSMEAAVHEFISAIDHAKDSRCMTGITALDHLTGGFAKGAYVAIGARPSVGKSAFALHCAVNIAQTKGPVLMVSLEMQPGEIVSRQVAAVSGVDGQRIVTGNLTSDDYTALAAAYPDIAKLPIRITTRSITPLQVRREAVRMQHGNGLEAIVIDYLGLMQPDTKTTNRYEAVSSISRDLKLLAMDLNVPILVLTQFNRNSEQGKGMVSNRVPSMSDARDSGSIEQDADVFVVMHTPPPPESPAPGDSCWEGYCQCERRGWKWQWLIVEKNRNGRKGLVNIGFDGAHMKYHSL